MNNTNRPAKTNYGEPMASDTRARYRLEQHRPLERTVDPLVWRHEMLIATPERWKNGRRYAHRAALAARSVKA